MSDPFEEPEMKAYLAHAKADMFPKLKGSALSLIIAADPDPKLCLELGAAILFDKPIVVLVPEGRVLPANLKRVASAVVEGDPSDPKVSQQMQDVIKGVINQDRRVKRSSAS